MTVEQCVVIGLRSGCMDNREVTIALRYYTNYTDQIQHSDIKRIEDTVWLDPQIISKVMSILISNTFHRQESIYYKEVEYQKTGRFPAADVKKILRDECTILEADHTVQAPTHPLSHH